jgi:excisionase family DNA binding protein
VSVVHRPRLDDFGDVLRPIDVQRLLGIGRNTMYDLLKSGTITSVRLHRKILVPRPAVEQYLQISEGHAECRLAREPVQKGVAA